MARGEIERTVQPSVLDRLIDLDPRTPADPPVSLQASIRNYKAAFRRDLEWLLNTRRTPEVAPPELEAVSHSLHHYGLPDVTSLSKDSFEDRLRLLRQVEETIIAFEPRLEGVRVSMVEGDGEEGSSRRELHFLIQGLLRMDPNPEQVVFDTVLELSKGEYAVKGEGGG